MSDIDLKQSIASTLARFGNGRLADNARDLFNVLGYNSDKTTKLTSSSPQAFVATFKGSRVLNEKNALLTEWTSAELIFQLTSAEVAHTGQRSLFEGDRRVDNRIIESYVFLAIGLKSDTYTRTQLAAITREVNKIFPMPALILFKHGTTLTLAVIDRRLHKRDESKDVLEKVTLIKDIRIASPHRAHLEILFDLSLDQLRNNFDIANWVQLHDAWRKTLDTSELNKRFFREIANWYFWAQGKVKFPKGAGKNEDERKAISVIRLLTRLIFVWFVKEKNLIPDELFDKRRVDELVKYDDSKDSTYYKAILQNLFFATLNTDMNRDKPKSREFRHDPNDRHVTDDYLVPNKYRYQKFFTTPQKFFELCSDIPFLNGGLFECLDRPFKQDEITSELKPLIGREGNNSVLRVDGFSERDDNELTVPDELFFGTERTVDLSNVYGDTKRKRERVRGLIHIFDSYKFTVDENTPIEEEIALDPELLGKVFENLLAAYNPETGVTARKQTGSFYTPREIVNYMADESLIAYLETQLKDAADVNARLRHLLSYNDEPHKFNDAEVTRIITALDNLKALDPACGSGAFPMGLLHKLVYVLRKLDPDNSRWKSVQTKRAQAIADAEERASELADIDDAFANDADYARKLYLIENCLYGVDIQPIAVQIAKLRCFISLIVDDKVDDAKPNRGIRPLPKLETKFVAANSLIGIERPAQLVLRNTAIDAKEKELAEARKKHFTARTHKSKEKYRALDAKLRAEIGDLLRADGFTRETTEKLAAWNPYDQNTAAEFFDAEWMFGINVGFDIVIGNPPYLIAAGRDYRDYLNKHYDLVQYQTDFYVFFIELGLRLTRQKSTVAYITSDSWLNSQYFSKLRNHLLDTQRFRVVAVFDFPVFENANMENAILILDTATKPETFPIIRFKDLDTYSIVNTISPQDAIKRGMIDPHFSQPSNEIIDKMDLASNRLEDFTKINRGIHAYRTDGYGQSRFGSGYQTKKDKEQESYHSDKPLDKTYLPELKGRNVDRFIFTPAGRYISYGNWLAEPREPEFFQKPKLALRKILGERLHGTFIEEPYALDQSLYVVISKSDDSKELKFLLGVLLSRVGAWYLRNKYAIYDVLYPWYTKKQLADFPIKKSSEGQIIKLVDRILTAKRKDPDADMSALEQEIDELVYQLYGLTQEEITVVEGKNSVFRAIH